MDSSSWVRCASGNVSMISSENEGHRCDAGQSDEKEDRKCLVAPQRVRITMLAPTEGADYNACTSGGADNNTFLQNDDDDYDREDNPVSQTQQILP